MTASLIGVSLTVCPSVTATRARSSSVLPKLVSVLKAKTRELRYSLPSDLGIKENFGSHKKLMF